jgi:hypothetical protein
MKTLIINKCMERNSGDFYAIEDFKISKRRSGVGQAAYRRQQNYTTRIRFYVLRKVEQNRIPEGSAGGKRW